MRNASKSSNAGGGVVVVAAHCYGMTRSSFTRQHLGLPHGLAHCVCPGWDQLVSIVLLLLMGCV